MITKDGYSKDPSIIAEGIVITWKKDMFPGSSFDAVMRLFEYEMDQDDGLWVQKQAKAPTRDILYVYVIIEGFIEYRCNYAGWSDDELTIKRKNGIEYKVPWPRILIAGPLERPSSPFKLTGFQGFRYCTKLF